MAFWNRRKASALTASAQRMTRSEQQAYHRLIQPWHNRAFTYRDLLGEINYASKFYGRALKNVEFYAGEHVDGEWVATQNQTVIDAVERLQIGSWVEQYGVLMFLTGEGLLFATKNTDTQREQWEFVSKDELKVLDSGRYQRIGAPGMIAEELIDAVNRGEDVPGELLDKETVVYRMWQPHPRYSMLSDSPMQSVLDICLAEGTLIETTRGPLPIQEVEPGDTVWSWTKTGLEQAVVKRRPERGVQPVLRIRTRRQDVLATDSHRFLVLRTSKPGKGRARSYETEWVKAKHLRRDDRIVSLDHLPDAGEEWWLPDGTEGTEDIAWLLGQIVGDGHVSAEGVQIATFDDAASERCSRIMLEEWGLANHPYGGSCRFNSRRLRDMLAVMGLRVKSHRKTVPAIVWQMPREHQLAFIEGYEQADAHEHARGYTALAMSSERLARELQALYRRLGYATSRVTCEMRKRDLVIAGQHLARDRQRPLHRLEVYKSGKRTRRAVVFNGRDRAGILGDNAFTVNRVLSIEPSGEAPTYDLDVPGPKNFIADGLVSHNCEELVLLTGAIRSRALNRTAGNGILLWPEEASFRETDTIGDEDPKSDPLIDEITEAMSAPTVDPGTASAVVPLLIRLQSGLIPEAMGGPRHLTFDHKGQAPYGEAEVRSDSIKRLAIGLDMPPEILLGLQDSNHWTAWQIDEQVWEAHILPVTVTLCSNLTQHYLYPTISDLVPNPEDFMVMYDEAAVVKRPDRSSDAKDLHDRGSINDRALREANAFDEDDMPSAEEPNSNPRVILALARAAGYGGPSAGEGTPQETAAPPAAPEDQSVAAALVPVAAIAVARCRELAGNRIMVAARKANVFADGYETMDILASHAAVVYGERQVTRLTSRSAADLVQGGAKVLLESLHTLGYTAEEALCVQSAVEQYAAATLYEEAPASIPLELLEAPCFA